MRSELVEIENIEAYLEGELSGNELTSFEQQLKTDPTFREKVLTQKKLVNRIKKMGKIEAAKLAHQAHMKKVLIKGILIKTLIAISATGAILFGSKKLMDNNNEVNKQSSVIVEYEEQKDGTLDTSDDFGSHVIEDNSETVESTETKEYQKKVKKKNKKKEVSQSKGSPLRTDTLDITGQEQQEDSVIQEELKLPSKTGGYRQSGVKMYLTSNDDNAKTHFEREVQDYKTWVFVDNEDEAQYEVRLFEVKDFVDRLVWIEIRPIGSDEVLYTSPQARGINGGMRTVNIKQAAVRSLVHEHLKKEFFN